MMEAIRLSLAAEEERKKREEKEAAKDAKKEEKKRAKEFKKVARAQRHIESGFHPLDIDGPNDSGAGTSSAAGKGKQVDRSGGSVGFNPLTEPTSTINASLSQDNAQRHLEDHRAHVQRESCSTGHPELLDPANDDLRPHRSALRNLSEASSSASSFAESLPTSPQHDSQVHLAPGSSYGHSPDSSGLNLSQGETPLNDSPGTEPMFNFNSLAKAITPDEKSRDGGGSQYIEDVEAQSAYGKDRLEETSANTISSGEETLGESVGTLKAAATSPVLVTTTATSNNDHCDEEISSAPPIHLFPEGHSHGEQKQMDDFGINTMRHQATQ